MDNEATKTRNGLPIIVPITDDEGMSQATIYFASCRKCSDLLPIMQAIDAIDAEDATVNAQLIMMRPAEDATPEQIEAAFPPEKIAKVNDLTARSSALATKRLCKIGGLYDASLSAAGYSADDIDAIAQHVTVDMYPKIRELLLTGFGNADFRTGPPRDPSANSASE